MSESNEGVNWTKMGAIATVVSVVVALAVALMPWGETGSNSPQPPPSPSIAPPTTQAADQDGAALRTPTRSTQPPDTETGNEGLVINLDLTDKGKIGPSEYRAGTYWGVGIDVFDRSGSVSSGCYTEWTLRRDGEAIYTNRGKCIGFGLTSDQMKPGTHRITAAVTTDSGLRGEKSEEFIVR